MKIINFIILTILILLTACGVDKRSTNKSNSKIEALGKYRLFYDNTAYLGPTEVPCPQKIASIDGVNNLRDPTNVLSVTNVTVKDFDATSEVAQRVVALDCIKDVTNLDSGKSITQQ